MAAEDPQNFPIPAGPTTLETLLHLVEETLADDRANGEALEARRTHLLGFTGIILSLLGSLGANHLNAAHGTMVNLPYLGRVSAGSCFKGAFFAAVVLLAITAIVAIQGVRAKRKIIDADGNEKDWTWTRTGLADETLEGFTDKVKAWTPAQVQDSMISATVTLIREQRQLDGLRRNRNARVGGLLTVALMAVALQAAILVFHG